MVKIDVPASHRPMKKNILVTYEPGLAEREIYQEILEDLAQVHYLQEESGSNRSRLLKAADIVISLSFSQKEIHSEEIPLLQDTRFIQLVYAGADNIPFEHIPAGIILASNVGAFAGPIAEHVLALTLALAKKLVPKNKLLQDGKFDRTGFNQEIRGCICGLVGFGGNGQKIAAAMQAMGLQIYGINRSGRTDAPADFIGTLDDLRKVLEVSDILVLCTPLTRATRDLIGKKELAWMKKDAILINVGRGDVVNQKALYEHLKSHPEFRAGIDTWWSEPVEPGPFKLEFPFFELPNIIGSPHCADHVAGAMPHATRKALENVKNFLLGQEIRGRLCRQDYLA
jgi:phosphoglycerate dehydrogenase-like enzyme